MSERDLIEMAMQIATQLAPCLMKSMDIAYKEGAKIAGAKVTEAAQNKTRCLWNKILSAGEKKNPEASKALQELAQKPEDLNSDVLSWNLVKILRAMSPEELDEIWVIVNESRSETGGNNVINKKNVIEAKSKIHTEGNFRIGDDIYNIQTSKEITIKEIDDAISIGDAMIRDRAFVEATKEYEHMLTKAPSDKFPKKYIKITNSLGIAYWCLASEKKSPVANLEKAIHAYQRALKIAIVDKYPVDYALINNNLGNTYNMLSEYKYRSLNLQKAIDAYDESFKVYSIDKYPDDYTRVMSQKRHAFQSLLAIEDIKSPECASRQYYIGYYCLKASMVPGNQKISQMAVTSFEKALKVYSPNTTPNEYASTSSALGSAYMILSDVQDRESNLDKAVQAYQNALLVYDLKSYPSGYGIAQKNLGIAFSSLSNIKDKENNLKNSIRSTQEALKVFYGNQALAEELKLKIESDQNILSQSY